VVGGATYLGLHYFFGNTSVRTYQQCLTAGGQILTTFPAQCVINTADGPLTFTEPIAQEIEIPDPDQQIQPLERDPSLEAQAAAQGRKIRYHDEVGFRVITPETWNEHVELIYGTSAERAPGFYPALQVGPVEDLGGETRVITFSQPLDPAAARGGHAAFIANGLANIPTAPEITQLASAFQSVDFQPTTVAGLPALSLTRQVVNNLTDPPTGYCAGCWQRRVYIELPSGEVMEVSANWAASEAGFASQFDQVLTSFQLYSDQQVLPPTP
jgi:hypothetical protein